MVSFQVALCSCLCRLMKMKMMMTVLWVLLPYGVSAGSIMSNVGHKPVGSSPLDMAKNSVDDMYDGCSTEMKEKAKEYLKDELNKDPLFKKTWMEAKQKYQKKFARYNKKKVMKQILALHVYLFIKGNMYQPFNEATREQGPEYKTTFKYHALHFYLTRALQTRQKQDTCYNVFRRTNESFQQDVLNKKVRLGSFASSSLNQDLVQFGDQSCFEIETCMGVDVSVYSKYEIEAEVLIPPYEVFKVTKITRRSEQPGLWCHVVYKLKSTKKPLSNLNCTLIEKKGWRDRLMKLRNYVKLKVPQCFSGDDL